MAEGTEEVEEPTPVVPEKGTFVFSDGSQYDGEWVMLDDVRQRHGKGTYTDGPEKYDGDWKCDRMHGKGTYTFASKAQYNGDFCDNKFEGTGSYVWPDGRRYDGQWKDSKFHGKGKYVDADKVTWEGVFFNGKLRTNKSYLTLS